VATVTLTFVEAHPTFPCVAFPNGIVEEFPFDAISALDWQPPPWEPEVGKCASWRNSEGISMIVIVLCIDAPDAWVKLPNNHNRTVFICDLTPPKGGA
jgi:hypothetical protein